MATHTDLIDGPYSAAAQQALGVKAFMVTVDLTDHDQSQGRKLINSGDGVAATDVIELMTIPAGATVVGVYIYPEDVSTIDDLDIGITGGDTDGYVDGADLTSTNAIAGTGALVVAGGTVYTAADTLDALVNTSGTHTTGVFHVKVLMILPNT